MPHAVTRTDSTPVSLPQERFALAWLRLCVALASASAIVWWYGLSAQWTWNAAQWQSQPWTLWSASLAHLSALHLFGNLLALAVLAVLGLHLQVDRRASWAVLLAWPLATLGLGFWPQIAAYSGLSGLLCAMLGVLWFHAAMDGARRLASWALALALAFKLLSEHAWSQPVVYDPHWGFNVVVAAHLAGALSGAGCAAFVWLLTGAGRRN